LKQESLNDLYNDSVWIDFTLAFTSLSFCCYVNMFVTVTLTFLPHSRILTPSQLQHYQRKHSVSGGKLYQFSCFISEVVLLTIVHIVAHLQPSSRLQHKTWQYINFLPHETFSQTSSSSLCTTHRVSLWKEFLQQNGSGFSQLLMLSWYHWLKVEMVNILVYITFSDTWSPNNVPYWNYLRICELYISGFKFKRIVLSDDQHRLRTRRKAYANIFHLYSIWVPIISTSFRDGALLFTLVKNSKIVMF
jgi:hypothetical protein